MRRTGHAEQQPLRFGGLGGQLLSRSAGAVETPRCVQVQGCLCSRQAPTLRCQDVGRPASCTASKHTHLPWLHARGIGFWLNPWPAESYSTITKRANDEAPPEYQGQGKATTRIACAALEERCINRLKRLGDDCQQLVVFQVCGSSTQSREEVSVEAFCTELSCRRGVPKAVCDQVERRRLVQERQGLPQQLTRPRELGQCNRQVILPPGHRRQTHCSMCDCHWVRHRAVWRPCLCPLSDLT
mmetsp:Transcript_98037/g.272842  ORF Transcript_98037/g.272842 Transcript_98037/m.272842 type:complete len:242 (+) Transcript_98037:385-1110(+)